jgi:hypothetical protein
MSEHANLAQALRQLADLIEREDGTDVSVSLEAKIWRPVTAEKLLRQDELRKQGIEADFDGPTTLTVNYGSRRKPTRSITIPFPDRRVGA